MAERRILIVGGGIAGLTAAAALGQRGFVVDLVELKPELSDSGGVGLSLVGNAMRALDQIGAADACLAAGIPADNMAICRPDGTLLLDNQLPRIGGPKWPGATGISRAALHSILIDTARRAGVRARCGVTVSDWDDDSTGVDVRFSEGRNGRYALMIGADGLYSETRKRAMPDTAPAYTGQAVWRAETPRPERVTRTHIHFGGAHDAVGICPISRDRAYLYVVEAAPDRPRRDPATLHLQMRDRLAGYGGLVADLAATIDRPEKLSYRPQEWILAPRPWGIGRVVLIGDAVHANPPVLAQGAAMAMEDAVVLAEELAEDGDVDLAFTRFLDRRYARCARVVEASCALARAEVEHRSDLDVAEVMRSTASALAEPA